MFSPIVEALGGSTPLHQVRHAKEPGLVLGDMTLYGTARKDQYPTNADRTGEDQARAMV
jgi:hypothetical protein